MHSIAAMDPHRIGMITVAAVVTGGVTLAGWMLVLPRLKEPVTEEDKIPYRELARWRVAVAIGVFSTVAAATAWLVLPVRVQPLWSVLSIIGVALAGIDGFTTWIPARQTRWSWTVMGLAAAASLLVGAGWTDLLRTLAGAAAAGALYAVLWALTRHGFGFGDVRFMPLIGAATAAYSWNLLLAALLIGSLTSLVFGVWRLLRHTQGLQPWAPALLLGSYAALLTI